MRGMRPFAVVLATITVAGAAAPTFRELAPGTMYTMHSSRRISSAATASSDSGWTANVAWAAGRGRMDIVSGSEGQMFRAGDYILFDTTDYIIVHPASRTYSTLPNFASMTSAMPAQMADMMKLSDVKLSVDTLESGMVNGFRAKHYRMNMSFTMTLDMSSFGVSSAETPPPMRSEMKSDVWYADSVEATPNPFMKGADEMPSMPFIKPILDEMKKVRTSLPAQRLAVKMGNSVHISGMGTENSNESSAEITNFRRGEVDAARLVLPAAYTQAPIAGMDMLGPPTPLTPESLARWRAVPGRR